MTLTYVLFALIMALQVVDIYTTREIMRRPTGVEKNPIARKLMERVGVDAAIVIVKAPLILLLTMTAFVEWYYYAVVVAWYAYWMRLNWINYQKGK